MSAATRYLPTIAAALLCALFVRLGWWQLERAQEKQQLLESFADNARQPPLSLEGYQPQERFAHVRLSGRYLDYGMLLDNQIRDGRPGVYVLTLFAPAAGPPRILVNRGWRPLAADRRVVGELPPPPAGAAEVSGLLNAYPRPGIRLGEVDYLAPPPRLVPYVEPGALGAALKTEIAPQILLLIDDGSPDQEWVRDWTPDFKPRPQRHRAYAWQWFSLAAAVVIVYTVLIFRRRPR